MWFCFAKGHSGDVCLSSSILLRYECRVRHLFVLIWPMVRWITIGECCTLSGMVFLTVVFSVVEICVDYGGMYVFHVCFDLFVVYGVGFCVNVCVVECGLFLTSWRYVLCFDVV